MHVGFDCDDVLSSFPAGLKAYLKHRGLDYELDFGVYPFYKNWPLSTEEALQFWKDGVREGFIFGSKPFPGVVDGINSVRAAGHKVHIITHRGFEDEPGLAEDWTVQVLARDGIKYDSLTFSGDKTVVWTDMMVDDMPRNYDALTAAGTDAYLLTRPWNTHIEGAQRVRSCAEFCRKVLERS